MNREARRAYWLAWNAARKVPCPKCGGPKERRSVTCYACRCSASMAVKSGPSHYRWKGGRSITSGGYVYVYSPDHPKATKMGKYVREHVLVMERLLGRFLVAGENVHHKNGIKTDNRPENLELWSTAQPAGQRVEDKLAWARSMIETYEPSWTDKHREVAWSIGHTDAR